MVTTCLIYQHCIGSIRVLAGSTISLDSKEGMEDICTSIEQEPTG